MRYSVRFNSASIKYLPAHSYRSDTHYNEFGCAHAIAGEIRERDWDVEDDAACAWTYAGKLESRIIS